jgi:hypothetical protein
VVDADSQYGINRNSIPAGGSVVACTEIGSAFLCVSAGKKIPH